MIDPDEPARILVVDDDPLEQKLLQVMLAPEDVVVVSASSGEEGLELVALARPDLILLDVLLPGIDGFEVVTRLKRDPETANIPIILVTALSDREARVRGLSAGAEDFLSKPIDRAELCARVRNLLRLKAYGDFHDRYGAMLGHLTGEHAVHHNGHHVTGHHAAHHHAAHQHTGHNTAVQPAGHSACQLTARGVAKLIASEALYRSAFAGTPLRLALVRGDGRWMDVSQPLCAHLGATRAELLAPPSRPRPPPRLKLSLAAEGHAAPNALWVFDDR